MGWSIADGLMRGSDQPPWLLHGLASVAIGLAGLIYFTDHSQSTRELSATDFGAEWPWPTASRAMVQCHLVRDRFGNERPFIQVVLNGSSYALNSPALEASGWPDSRQMMAQNGTANLEAEGRKEVIQRGRALCGLPRSS